MSDISSSDAEKPMEQPEHDLSKAMGQLTVTSDSSNKSSPTLSEMPVDVVSLIIERSKYREQLKLLKVSKSLRALVDSQKPACKSIQIECFMDNVDLIFDDQRVMYTKQLYDNEDRDDYGLIVFRDDFMKAAFDDLASTLKNPKLRLEKFNTSVDSFVKENLEEFYNEIHRVLESLNHQLFVKKVKLDVLSPSNLLSILACLKPGFLEKISLSFDHSGVDWRNESYGMDKVALLEQWKQAEELELEDFFDRFPMRNATHFKRFRIPEEEIETDKFIRIKDFLSELGNFEHCIMSCWEFSEDPNSVHRLLGAPFSSNETEEVFCHSIPDSNYYFEFTWPINGRDVEIKKKKRENN